jgi:mevalonate kinase
MNEPTARKGSIMRSADSERVTAFAPGKIILFGEHAVVYGRPAIAVPVSQVHAEATIEPASNDDVLVHAADVGRQYKLDRAPADDPIAAIVRLACEHLNVPARGFRLYVHSTIPVARGLGSGAAVSVAVAHAVAGFFQKKLSREELSGLAFQVEKLHHGTPSGIDNTVIAFEQPVYFVRGEPVQSFRVARPFLVAIADTGVPAPTKVAVGDVRRGWEADRAHYDALFDKVGAIARSARTAIEGGRIDAIGTLMDENHALLREMGVSSTEVEKLIEAALRAGALGAKLSGGGRGGNIIALVEDATRDRVEKALRDAGAVNVILTRIE